MVAVGVAAYLAAGEPAAGAAVLRRLRAGRLTRVAVYRLTLATQWGLAVAAAVVVATGEWDAADVGLAWPEELGRVAPAFAGFLVALVAGAVAARRAGGIPTGADDLLPRTGEERGWFAAVAVTAGCCEELLYRGVLIAFGTSVLGLGVWPAAAIAVVVFGAAHLYQGATGALLVTVLGALFAAAYVVTGSLLLPVAAHVLLDLRALALPVARR